MVLSWCCIITDCCHKHHHFSSILSLSLSHPRLLFPLSLTTSSLLDSLSVSLILCLSPWWLSPSLILVISTLRHHRFPSWLSERGLPLLSSLLSTLIDSLFLILLLLLFLLSPLWPTHSGAWTLFPGVGGWILSSLFLPLPLLSRPITDDGSANPALNLHNLISFPSSFLSLPLLSPILYP